MQVSQALVTKQIQDLESWLGARLLNRTTRRLSLIEVGMGVSGANFSVLSIACSAARTRHHRPHSRRSRYLRFLDERSELVRGVCDPNI
jgi:DNA-binding transcriptional LysR family regulator